MSDKKRTGEKKMTQVKKRSGELQEFDRKKLLESVKRAGVDERIAKQIADKVEVADGATTADLRIRVAEELRKVKPSAADAYLQTLRLQAKAHDDLPKGTARVPKRIERVPDVKPGQPARVKYRDMRTEVRIEPALETREIWMNRNDLAIIGAQEGTRIAVRFLEEGTGVPPASAIAAQPASPMSPKAA